MKRRFERKSPIKKLGEIIVARIMKMNQGFRERIQKCEKEECGKSKNIRSSKQKTKEFKGIRESSACNS